MISTWTAGLTKEEANEVRSSFDAAAFLRKRLSDMLEDKINSQRKESLSKAKYENASWAYYQADVIGYERALNEVISLISSTSVEKAPKKG